MSKPRTLSAWLVAVGLVAAFCLPSASFGLSCRYDINFENEAGEDVEVQNVKWKKKEYGDWKPWRNVELGPVTLSDKQKEEYSKTDKDLTCYRFKWKLEWRCASNSTWNDYQIPADDPDNDRGSNWYLQFDGCNKGDVERSEDGDFF